MPLDQFDPDIINDFVTESSELLESLDQQLVSLEQNPEDPDLLNCIFRALHTIKGSSSFLALGPLTEFAHAAEDALNALRKAEAAVTPDTMDLLLRSVDVLRGQMDEVRGGEMPSKAPADLATALGRIGGGGEQRAVKRDAESDAESTVEATVDGEPETPAHLELPDSKRELLPFMVEDFDQAATRIKSLIEQLSGGENHAAAELYDLLEETARSADFFEVAAIVEELRALEAAANAWVNLDAGAHEDLLPRMIRMTEVLIERGKALADQQLPAIDTGQLQRELTALAAGETIETTEEHAAEAEIPAAATDNGNESKSAADDGGESKSATDNDVSSRPVAEHTIRVDVERLETLLNLVGELVLQKNRVLGVGKRAGMAGLDHEFVEQLGQIGGDLDRVTGDLQMSVMKTRMQPLSKLFNRYPRVVRDLARTTGKKIDLEIVGGDTEVDKSVIEGLGDPLVHILRNSGDHGVEPPDQRQAAGKDETGKIRLSARQEGSHVVVEVADDGRGLDPEKIGKKAVERGLVTADILSTMSEKDIVKLIFAPGFSTAEKVSDVSGRGVGMDVVRTNITKLNGTVDVESKLGEGSLVSIRIPLTVAIMPAMVVVVSDVQYAVPLTTIMEIVRPQAEQTSCVNGRPVLRLRDSVLPLIDLTEWFDGKPSETNARIAVIVALAEKRFGLLVDGLEGQQEVVIKPLDSMLDRDGAISGATVREDGGVSLILDVAALARSVEVSTRQAA